MSQGRCTSIALVLVVAAAIPAVAAGASVSGKVADESGLAVKRAAVTIESLDRTTRSTKATELDGSFGFAGIPAGTYSVSVNEPDHVLAIYGPLKVTNDGLPNLSFKLERLPNDGRDSVTCNMSLVFGQVADPVKTPFGEMLLCMDGTGGRTCTHLTGTGSYSLAILPGKYQLTLYNSGKEVLVSQLFDVTYCGDYRSKINLIQ